MSKILFLATLVFVFSLTGRAQSKFSVDGGECGGPATAKASLAKTEIRKNEATGRRAYGVLEYRRSEEDVSAKRCSGVYRLMVDGGQGKFHEVKRLAWQTEEGEIAGIDLVGFSPDGTKLAADFWLAEGDWTEHRVQLSDLQKGESWFRSINDLIYKRSTGKLVDFENYYETLHEVRNDGQVVVTAHADGGRKPDGSLSKWLFDPKTGRVTPVARK